MIIFVQMGKGKGENMIDMNEIITNNITILRNQTDLAEVGGKQIKLSARTMNAGELRDIAKYLGTTVDKLTCPNAIRGDAISRIMRKIHTDSAREALDIADKLSDMILFHKTVRENGTEMMKPWKDA